MEASRALVASNIARDPVRTTQPSVAAADLDAALRRPALASGYEAITAWLAARLARAGDRDAFVLVGSYHDAAGQIRAFQRLIGPSGIHGLTHVAVEQFAAAGAWSGPAPATQRGDTDALEAYVRRGDVAAFEALRTTQSSRDYSAWKFDYVADVLDLLATARATGTPLLGVDLPAALSPAEPWVDTDLNGLRELHAWFSLRDTLSVSPGPHRIAMLWGQAHVEPRGFRRFVPTDATVISVYLFGHRPGAALPPTSTSPAESHLRIAWILNDPIAVALDPAEEHIALVLPDAWLGGQVERVRAHRVPGGVFSATPPGQVTVRSLRPGRFAIGTQTVDVGAEPRTVTVPPARHTYAFTVSGVTTLGALSLGASDGADIDFDPATRATRIQYVSQ